MRVPGLGAIPNHQLVEMLPGGRLDVEGPWLVHVWALLVQGTTWEAVRQAPDRAQAAAAQQALDDALGVLALWGGVRRDVTAATPLGWRVEDGVLSLPPAIDIMREVIRRCRGVIERELSRPHRPSKRLQRIELRLRPIHHAAHAA